MSQVWLITGANAGFGRALTEEALAAGHTVVVKLTPPRAGGRGGRESAFAVVITPLPGSGPVYAGRVTSLVGVVRSILPVASSLSWVPLPAVRSSLRFSPVRNEPGRPIHIGAWQPSRM